MTTFSPPSCSDEPIWNAWMAAFHIPTLAVADELGLFARLSDGAKTIEALAREMEIEVRATEAMAGVMTSLGFLARADGRYGLTEVARTYLVPDSPYYWGGMIKRMRDNPIDCRKLVDSLRRGKAAESAALSQMWDAPTPPPEQLVKFTHAMHAHSFALAMRMAHLIDVPAGTKLLDVAGGSGSYSIAAMLLDPELRGTLLELPPVGEIARTYAEKHGVSDRLSVVAGDMFRDAWPTGHDRVLMADIFHDWSDARCRVLAQRAFDALVPGGKIMLHEMLLSDTKDGSANAAAYSMIMVFVTEGRQRTLGELRAILEGAGFTNVTATATANGFSLIEAEKA